MKPQIADYNNDLLKLDKDWWQLRACIIATDKGRGVEPQDLEYRIWLRRN